MNADKHEKKNTVFLEKISTVEFQFKKIDAL